MRRVEGNDKATKKPGGITGKGFRPGRSGNPGGMKPMPADLKAALAADTWPRYERLKALSAKAEAEGDLKTAAHIELSLLKKSVPDATTLIIQGPDGGAVQVTRLDPKKCTREQLEAVLAVMHAQKLPERKGEAMANGEPERLVARCKAHE
jgi:hypothetical protein